MILTIIINTIIIYAHIINYSLNFSMLNIPAPKKIVNQDTIASCMSRKYKSPVVGLMELIAAISLRGKNTMALMANKKTQMKIKNKTGSNAINL